MIDDLPTDGLGNAPVGNARKRATYDNSDCSDDANSNDQPNAREHSAHRYMTVVEPRVDDMVDDPSQHD